MLVKAKFFVLMIVFTISAFLISACDNKPAKSKIENPLAGHAKALEKAKDVEKQLLEAQLKTQEAIDKATQ